MFKYILFFLTGYFACFVSTQMNPVIGNMVSIVLFAVLVGAYGVPPRQNTKNQQKQQEGKKNG